MSEEKEKEKIPERYLPCIEIPGRQIYESVIHQNLPAYLVYDFNEQKFFFVGSKPSIDYICCPLPKGGFPYRPYWIGMNDLDKIEKFNPSKQELYNKVYEIYDEFLDLKEEYKALETVTTLETYEQHKVQSLGYLYHTGDNESGKTRALEIHLLLDYRAMLTANLPPADVYSYIGQEQEATCTILEDGAHELTRRHDLEKLKLYRVGYKQGAVVPRIVEPTSKKRTQIFYKAFCAKSFAGKYFPKDRDFCQRLIPVPMVWGFPQKDEFSEEDKVHMDKIKLGLLIYRMRYYYEPLPNIDTKLRGRPKELWKSKLQIVSGLEHEKHIVYLSEEFLKERIERRKHSLEAYMTKALLRVEATKEQEIEFSWIWHVLLEELGVDTEKEEEDSIKCPMLGYKLTKKAVGGRLHSVFHGKAELRHKIGRTWKFEKEKIERLKRKFYID